MVHRIPRYLYRDTPKTLDRPYVLLRFIPRRLSDNVTCPVPFNYCIHQSSRQSQDASIQRTYSRDPRYGET